MDVSQRSILGERLVESGEKHKLVEFLRAKLRDCGWREEMESWCKDQIEKKGAANLTVDWVMNEATPHATATVPATVKSETLQRIRWFIAQKMTHLLEPFIDHTIEVVTNDGRVMVGVLRGYDQVTNVILDECHERVFSSSKGVEKVPLGLYVIRGDNVALIGLVNEELDKSLDFAEMKAEPLCAVRH